MGMAFSQASTCHLPHGLACQVSRGQSQLLSYLSSRGGIISASYVWEREILVRAQCHREEAGMLEPGPSAEGRTLQRMVGWLWCVGASLPCCAHWSTVLLLLPQQRVAEMHPEKDFALIFSVAFVFLPLFACACAHTHSHMHPALPWVPLCIYLLLQQWEKLYSTSVCIRAWTQAATLMSWLFDILL